MPPDAWTPDEDRDPWERQTGESARAFRAFAEYRDMGAERSTAKVAQRLGRTKALMDRFSSRWSWVARAQAFDVENDRDRLRRMRERYERTNEAIHGIGVSILNKVQARLVKLDGEDLDKMPLADLARLYAQATRAIRLVQGEPTERIAAQVGPDDPEAERELALSILRNPEAADHARRAIRAIAAAAHAGPGGPGGDGDGGDA